VVVGLLLGQPQDLLDPVPRPDSVGRLFSSSCLLVVASFCSSTDQRCSAWRSRRWRSVMRVASPGLSR
jgi:hypothetical protein